MKDGDNGTQAESGRTLGTFAGVFTPSILTILGIILFLRLGFVVGNAGLLQALLIIALANVISVLTSVSLSAIATNLKVKGGGDYFLISRTLGREFGGALGIVLFLAQSISIAFYAIGFGEALDAVLSPVLETGGGVLPQLYAAGAILVLFFLAWLGADWATRFQFGIMAVLGVALCVFLAGGITSFDSETLGQSWSSSGELPFWAAFALFFPAVTGFTQGVSLSGNLKDPSKSLPLGTFLAVGVSFVVYIVVTILFAGSLPLGELASDYRAMHRVSLWPWMIDAGVVAATLSSALASFLGAPRILQSLARDRLFKLLSPFSVGVGPGENPRRGVLLSLTIALITVAIGNLNLIAPVVAMFFLISYGLLNYATYVEASANSPSFRPRFRWYSRSLSLAGCLACAGAIVAIHPVAGVVAFALLIAVHQYLKRKVSVERWADSSWSSRFQKVRQNLFAMSGELVHPRDWRPVILAFSDDPGRRERLLRFASWIDGGSGVTTAIRIVDGEGPASRKEAAARESELRDAIESLKIEAFAVVIASNDPAELFAEMLQAHGLGPIRVNTVLLNWFDQQRVAVDSPGLKQYGQHLRTAVRFGRNVVVLKSTTVDIARLEEAPLEDRRIDVWWRDDATSRLALLLAYLAKRRNGWERATLRVLAARAPKDADTNETPLAREEQALQSLKAMLDDIRIDATPHLVDAVDARHVTATSGDATLVFVPFRVRNEEPVDVDGEELDAMLDRLPMTALVLAAQDIQLDSEPDESLHGEIAAALEEAEKAERSAQKKEKEASSALEAAEAKREAVEAALEKGASEEEREELEREVADLQAEAEEARRRAAKARTKADSATSQAEAIVGKNGDDEG